MLIDSYSWWCGVVERRRRQRMEDSDSRKRNWQERFEASQASNFRDDESASKRDNRRSKNCPCMILIVKSLNDIYWWFRCCAISPGKVGREICWLLLF